jgi:LysR family transcriptional regulator, low CO2-responsive transcriptional regulator
MLHTQLRAFHAVARNGSFTQAARELNVSQPTLSAEVKALEDRYAVLAFLRSRRKVELTPFGDSLFAITRRLFAVEQEAIELLEGSRDLVEGQIHIGADGPFHAVPLIAAFSARHPGPRVKLSVGNAESITRDLLALRLDIAVLANPSIDPQFFAIPLGRDPIQLMLPAEHRLARQETVDVRELENETVLLREPGSMTRRVVEGELAELEIRLRSIVEIASREAQREAVAAGLGIAFVSLAEFPPDPRLKIRPLAGCRMKIDEYVICLRERRRLGIVRSFLAVAEVASHSQQS